MIISKKVGITYTHRVTASEVSGGILIVEGEKRNGPGVKYDDTCVLLSREEIAKLADKFPVASTGKD